VDATDIHIAVLESSCECLHQNRTKYRDRHFGQHLVTFTSAHSPMETRRGPGTDGSCSFFNIYYRNNGSKVTCCTFFAAGCWTTHNNILATVDVHHLVYVYIHSTYMYYGTCVSYRLTGMHYGTD